MAKVARYTLRCGGETVVCGRTEKQMVALLMGAWSRHSGAQLTIVRESDGALCERSGRSLVAVGTPVSEATDAELESRVNAMVRDEQLRRERPARLSREEAADQAEDLGHYAEAERIRQGGSY